MKTALSIQKKELISVVVGCILLHFEGNSVWHCIKTIEAPFLFMSVFEPEGQCFGASRARVGEEFKAQMVCVCVCMYIILCSIASDSVKGRERARERGRGKALLGNQ